MVSPRSEATFDGRAAAVLADQRGQIATTAAHPPPTATTLGHWWVRLTNLSLKIFHVVTHCNAEVMTVVHGERYTSAEPGRKRSAVIDCGQNTSMEHADSVDKCLYVSCHVMRVIALRGLSRT